MKIISHILNEEYLLPFWLEHHASIFDHGIMIDSGSTDRSIELIRKMCPTWSIVDEYPEMDGIVLKVSEFFIPGDSLVYSMFPKKDPKNLKEFFDAKFTLEGTSPIQGIILRYDPTCVGNEHFNVNTHSSIYYSELVVDSHWGEDMILLEKDVNLLKNTDFEDGYKIVDIQSNTLKEFIRNEIKTLTQKDLENYHEITEEDHKKVLNAMPYKKHQLQDFSDYLEQYVSSLLKEEVKIFNDDIWFRICRPSSLCDNDYNPCHRDIYLPFYRNMVNIYVPVFGSDENSSLKLQPGSHKWNEKDTMVTKNGAYFKRTNKKYSVDAIVASTIPLDMIRPNPKENQMMIFSPYLIHGCAENENNTTRISLEVRFILKNNTTQEKEFNDFLKTRTWR